MLCPHYRCLSLSPLSLSEIASCLSASAQWATRDSSWSLLMFFRCFVWGGLGCILWSRCVSAWLSLSPGLRLSLSVSLVLSVSFLYCACVLYASQWFQVSSLQLGHLQRLSSVVSGYWLGSLSFFGGGVASRWVQLGGLVLPNRKGTTSGISGASSRSPIRGRRCTT